MKTLQNLPDNQLVTLYMSGDNSAFETLLFRYKDKVFRYILNIVKDEHVANDVFQETFIKIVVNIRHGKYFDDGKFASWVMRIAHNLSIDYFRKQSSENTVSHNDESHQNLENIISLMENNIQDVIQYEETLKEVELLMHSLPENQKEIVYMRFYQEMSFKEIAETLDISINTALGRMRYAILNMQKLATKYAFFY